MIWTIGGGKGGSGKSFITTNVGICLSKLGIRVVLIDADLGGANLHTFLGIYPPAVSLSDFIKKRVSHLNEVLIPTAVPNLQLLTGAQDLLNAADAKSVQKRKLVRSIQSLSSDTALVDLGAGNSLSVLDFFLMSDGGILVVTPEPTSIENSYRFLKSAFYRRLRQSVSSSSVKALIDDAMDQKNEMGILNPHGLIKAVKERDEGDARKVIEEIETFRPNLILNQVRSKKDIEVGFSIRSACLKYFGIHLHYLGYVVYDQDVNHSIRRRKPLVLENPRSRAAQCVMEIASKLARSHKMATRIKGYEHQGD
ncbi:MAG: ATP-binding protein [Deltaproteobacteria bacterium]|jgi:flagellar biosynthesis protein FlhG|nr:ATP-binding protein [Deltaproteobacteria bacterium]